MNIFVTGGYGFIGSAVIRNLLINHSHKVINIDSLTYAGNKNSIPDALKEKNYIFENIDICNKEAVREIFLKYKPDKLMHLAAESHVDRSIDNPDDFIYTNIIGTYNLLDISLEYFNSLDDKNNFLFHHISTDDVFGDLEIEEKKFSEDSSYKPSSPYSASKASADHLVRAWQRTFGLPTIITNCSNNYGPYHFPEKFIPHVILNALSGKPIPIYGDGQQIRDWLFVDDHSDALIEVMMNGVVGDTYLIGGNNEKTNLEVVETICNILDKLIKEKPDGIKSFSELISFVKDRPGHDLRYAIDSSKITKKLGWLPKESFETGIYKTVSWYLENEIWWKSILNNSYNLERLGKNEDQ